MRALRASYASSMELSNAKWPLQIQTGSSARRCTHTHAHVCVRGAPCRHEIPSGVLHSIASCLEHEDGAHHACSTCLTDIVPRATAHFRDVVRGSAPPKTRRSRVGFGDEREIFRGEFHWYAVACDRDMCRSPWKARATLESCATSHACAYMHARAHIHTARARRVYA